MWPFDQIKAYLSGSDPDVASPQNWAEPEERHVKTVVIGEQRSGKSFLIRSLRQCSDTKSYSNWQDVQVFVDPPRSRNTQARAETTAMSQQRASKETMDAVARGGWMESTQTGTLLDIELGWNVRVHRDMDARKGRIAAGSTFDLTCHVLDLAGELLFGGGDADMHWAERDHDLHYKRVAQHLQDAETIVLCIPIGAPTVGIEQYEQVFSAIRNGDWQRQDPDVTGTTPKRSKKLDQLIVVFTMYDHLIELTQETSDDRFDASRDFRLATNRDWARVAMQSLLGIDGHGEDEFMAKIGEQLDRASAHVNELVVFPTSSFGFVPGTGQANFSMRYRDDGVVDEDAQLMTRRHPTSDDNEGKAHLPYPEAYYSEHEIQKNLWRPFLTLDPFIYIGTGIRGELMFTWGELIAPRRRAARRRA